MTLPGALLRSLARIVGAPHILTGDATAGFAVDWTGRFAGHTPAVVRPGDTAEVAAVLALCTGAGVPVVPQGGNTGLVGGGVPLHGEVVLSLTRLHRLGPVDHEASRLRPPERIRRTLFRRWRGTPAAPRSPPGSSGLTAASASPARLP